jgi:hypothetical protein
MKLEVNVPVSGLDLASLLGGGTRRIPLSKQGTKLYHGCETWSANRLRADANRSGGSRTGASCWTRALVRHENQQLD